ncbi:E3 ubiquitin/ISG15 ligase TRIM25-like [Cololabis saira]|uniref:E3 ubiquitin/ISG15 ligase TRIM25-like n=1 Tax=Cololabis saira TaxID=129043 RepID=UPI002AD3B3C3|nr:E3 ubiquitin/ISG15 ligase TRIM25-like [Cololabis saira]
MADVDETGLSLMSLEDELTCSICLSTFDCPVTIPCGHNFCQDCLLATWRDSNTCPQCRTPFDIKPELKKNTVLSTVVETLGLRTIQRDSSPLLEETQPREKDVIRCDTCMEAEAAQTCLTCMASFCEQHLRPHRDNPIFRVHQLSDPVGDLSQHVCSDHHKLMEHFCTQHDRLICSLCLQQVHKGCSFTSPEEQRSVKENDFIEKLGLLEGKIERTDDVLFQMNDMQSKLKDAANKKKTALAAVYQQMRDMLAQDEHAAQHEVDCELEVGQMKLRDFMKRFTENSERMKKAREDVTSLLSQSQSPAFLQASVELPKVVKFEPHAPRVHLDSRKVMATQSFSATLKENLQEILAQPFEARLPLLQSGEKEGFSSSTASTEGAASQPESSSAADQTRQARSKSPAPPIIQPIYQPVHVPFYIQSQPSYHPQFPRGQSHGFSGGRPFFTGEKAHKKSDGGHQPFHNKKSDGGHQPFHKQDRKGAGTPGHKPHAPGSDSTKKDKPKSHPPSHKPAGHHPHPKKNK